MSTPTSRIRVALDGGAPRHPVAIAAAGLASVWWLTNPVALDASPPLDGVATLIAATCVLRALHVRPLVCVAVGLLGLVHTSCAPPVVVSCLFTAVVAMAALALRCRDGTDSDSMQLALVRTVTLVCAVQLLQQTPMGAWAYAHSADAVHASLRTLVGFDGGTAAVSLTFTLCALAGIGVDAARRATLQTVLVASAAGGAWLVAARGLVAHLPAATVWTASALVSGALCVVVTGVWLRPLVGRRRTSGVRDVLALALFAAGLVVSLTWRLPPLHPIGDRSVLIVTNGLQDWQEPQHGRYGAFSAGMFGRLPAHLELAGARVTRTEIDDLARRVDGERPDVVLFLNLDVAPLPDVVASLDRFVRDGGLVVVACDHTNVGGQLVPTNSLISQWGIHLNDDSAKSLVHWRRAASGGSAAWLANSLNRAGWPWGVGASLRVEGTAYPLLVGVHAFSDSSNPGNFVGSFLGDYVPAPDERIGDTIIVAAARVGSGAVLVLGDTTPLQNSALSSSTPYGVAGLFLSRPDDYGLGVGAPAAATAMILVLLACSVVRRRRATAIVVASAAAAALLVPGPRSELAGADDTARPLCIVLDDGLREVSDLRPRDRTSWSVTNSVARSGALVLSELDGPLACRRAARVFLSVLPLEEPARFDEVIRRVHDGASFVLIGGPRHAQAVGRLLKPAGLQIVPAALGPFPPLPPAQSEISAPRLPSAYAIDVADGARERTTPLISAAGVTCAVASRFGDGLVVVIADDSLPYGNFLEGDREWHAGNIAFLDRIWHLCR